MNRIRPAGLHDLPGVYRVCLETGDAGRDATALYRNPDLLGHVYVGPYVVGQPGPALVVADADGVAGYLLGAEDTRAFELWEAELWWPSLRAQYPRTDGDSPDEDIIGLIHAPPHAPDAVVSDYPSHLHIDLLERVRGRGIGGELVRKALARLGERGSPGVHLDVAKDNENAVGFYEHLGFVVLQAGDESLYMGMRLR